MGLFHLGIYHRRMAKSLHTPEYEYFRSLLVAAREKSGLTQTDVSARLNRPQSFVSKYESGERRLDVVELILVCAALGVEPQEIIHDTQLQIDKKAHSRLPGSSKK